MAELVPEPLKGPRREQRPPSIRGYEIEAVLGRGATGTVFRARQLSVDRIVALKVLHPELSSRPRLITRLQREARTSARLAHPGLVAAIDMGEVDGRWWYAMEYVDGPSLSLRLRQEGRLSEREALRLFIPLCEALEHLHEHGVVHRDIKPANILIDPTGRARLADLGLAFADDQPDLTRQGGTLGTPHYISPEQAIDPGQADVRSDIWSFGATLFHAVCGRPPFRGDSAAEILSAVLYARVSDPLELAPSLSRGLTLVLRKCLTRDPEGRYASPRELLADLERVRERRAPRVRRRTLDPVASRGPSRAAWFSAAGLLALLVAATVWTLSSLGERPAREESAARRPSAEHPALEAIAERYAHRPAGLASGLRELDALRPTLPERFLGRWQELRGTLIGELQAEVFALEDEFEAELEAELERRDVTAAWATLEEELEPRFLARTGFRPAELEPYGLSVATWGEPLAARVVARTHEATLELRRRLEGWLETLGSEVARELERRRWRKAYEALQLDRGDILAAVGFDEWRLPPEALEAEMLDARPRVTMLRLNVEDEWRTVDRDIARWVAERADTLERELEHRDLRRGAAEELRSAFELELVERRVDPDDALLEVSRTAWDRLERRLRDLAELEERLNEKDLRARFDKVEDDSRLYCELREYAFCATLWGDAEAALLATGEARDGWRAELLRRARLRQREVALLRALLQRVARGLVARDGQAVSLWMGSIRLREARLQVPADPLTEGFHIEGRSEVFGLRELHGSDFEAFAGLGDETALTPDDRLVLALFRYYDGRAQAARRTLLSGELPGDRELESDLRHRVLKAIEQEQKQRETVASQVRELLRYPLPAAPDAVEIEAALQRIRILLEHYGDTEEVREQRGELLALRERLIAARGESKEDALKRIYGPAELSFPRLARARLGFRFDAAEVRGWSSEDWRFDGLGWILFTPAARWEEVLAQRGPTLALVPPLDVDTSHFEVGLVVEEPESGPPQCLLLSAGGFHVAFLGEALPGGDGRARWAVGVGDLGDFVERLSKGEGYEAEELLVRGRRHEIVFRGYRGSGRYELELDGRTLSGSFPSPPAPSERKILLRSWEPVRLLEAHVEAHL